MRTLKWDPLFDPEEQTSIAIAWISVPVLPPNFFWKEVMFSLAVAVGKPLQVDLATQNKTRPSCASVKGHNKKECYILRPDLYSKEEEKDTKEKTQEEQHHGNREDLNNEEDKRTLEDKGKKKLHNEFQEQRRKDRYRRGRHNHKGRMGMTWNLKPQDLTTNNKFKALGDNMENMGKDNGEKANNSNKESEDKEKQAEKQLEKESNIGSSIKNKQYNGHESR
ncbi:hypothetical protein FXO37_04125 [Capsicum annuum]|nr:hypothetical protein FXO37_04125 [Capsicum annuum]